MRASGRDSEADFNKALPPQPGPWLILSTGGSDGAFGAGLLNGLSAGGKRPDYAVVTGVSTGALMAPFAFAGARYDATLQALYTQTSAADIFEVGGTGESFLDTWPLKDLIAKQITPALLADIAAAYKNGRRLFIVTTDLDAGRSMVWNMGAIAAHAQGAGGDDAHQAFPQRASGLGQHSGRLSAGADRCRSQRQAFSGNACRWRRRRTVLRRPARFDGKQQRLPDSGDPALYRHQQQPAAGVSGRRTHDAARS